MNWSPVEAIQAVRGHWLGYAYVIGNPDKSVNSVAPTREAAIAKCQRYVEAAR